MSDKEEKDLDFSKIAFPIVRRVFPGIVAQELVSVQPMSAPSGLLFHLDYVYGKSGSALLKKGGHLRFPDES